MTSTYVDEVLKVDSYVWFLYSNYSEKYRRGILKAVIPYADGRIVCEIIDETNGSSRTILREKVCKEKPPRKKRRSKKEA